MKINVEKKDVSKEAERLSKELNIDLEEVKSIIEDFGNMENFKNAYIQELVKNAITKVTIGQQERRMDTKIEKHYLKLRDKLVVGFDITQPNLIVSKKLKSLGRNSGEIETIGNFYNEPMVEELVNESLTKFGETAKRIFSATYGFNDSGEVLDEAQIAKQLSMAPSKVRSVSTAKYIRDLRQEAAEMENMKIDSEGREKFIKKYFETNDIFIGEQNSQITQQEREDLVGIYNEALEREEERQKSKIENFGLSRRLYLSLVRAGYDTIDDLLGINQIETLENIRGLGKDAIKEIMELVHYKGLRFAFEKDNAEKVRIKDLGLSRRSYLTLARAGYDTIYDLIEIENREDFESIRGLGKKSIEEIMELVHSKGLKFEFEVDDTEIDLRLQRTIQKLQQTYEEAKRLEKKYNELIDKKNKRQLDQDKDIGE